MRQHAQEAQTQATEDRPNELSRLLSRDFTPTDVLLHGDSLDRLIKFSEFMSRASVAIPAHFRNKPGDCLAIVMRAALWKLDPFSVASKCYVTPGGMLSYEAQLISAVVISMAPITSRPEFSFLGDWDKVLGKIIEKQGDKGKYYVAGWKPEDEAGLGVTCSCTLKGETEPRVITVMMSQCYPRFSTQWATDPQQQITYRAITKWARRYTPDVLLGIYSADEIEDPQYDLPTHTSQPTPAPSVRPEYPADKFDTNISKWRKTIANGRRTAEDVIGTISSEYTLTEKQKAKIREPLPNPGKSADVAQEQPVRAEDIERALREAKNQDQRDTAADLIGSIEDAEERARLSKLYHQGDE